MVLIEGGTFLMGSSTTEPERDVDETLHEVTVADFMMSRTEVSQQEYERVMAITTMQAGTLHMVKDLKLPTMKPLDPETMKLIFNKQR